MNRKEIMQQAADACFREMYAKAQPSANYDELVKGKREGTIVDTAEDPIFRRYYLSMEEFMYIRKKYLDAYRMNNEWLSNTDFLLECLTEGGYVDSYETDTAGDKVRTAKRLQPLHEIIGEENANKVIELINKYKHFYKFDSEESSFSCAVTLGPSPNSNKEAVIEYWKEHGVELEIEDRDPDTFWYRDEYGDEWEKIYNDELNEIGNENE